VTRADLSYLDPEGTFLLRMTQDRLGLTALARGLWDVTPDETQTRLTEIEVLAHRLGGAAGTFGYPAVSTASLELEDRVALRQEAAGSLGYRLAIDNALAGLLSALGDALEVDGASNNSA